MLVKYIHFSEIIMLELKHISFIVNDDKGEKEIIKDVSLTLDDGKFLVITGPNGGGKSTLAKLIMGIEKPTGGQIIWNGTDITNMSITDRAKLGIGYALQHPPRFKGLSVRDLLSLAHGSTLPETQCCGYLTQVGLCSKDYLNRQVDNSLSGGEIKRIEIATIMARDLSLAIYDEPEAGIDLWSFNMLVESFKNISKVRKESMVIISHQERIMKIADEIAIIADGVVKQIGPTEEIFPQLMAEFDNTCSFR
jgi:Fe-S cluster assembly ATP-binding protein